MGFYPLINAENTTTSEEDLQFISSKSIGELFDYYKNISDECSKQRWSKLIADEIKKRAIPKNLSEPRRRVSLVQFLEPQPIELLLLLLHEVKSKLAQGSTEWNYADREPIYAEFQRKLSASSAEDVLSVYPNIKIMEALYPGEYVDNGVFGDSLIRYFEEHFDGNSAEGLEADQHAASIILAIIQNDAYKNLREEVVLRALKVGKIRLSIIKKVCNSLKNTSSEELKPFAEIFERALKRARVAQLLSDVYRASRPLLTGGLDNFGFSNSRRIFTAVNNEIQTRPAFGTAIRINPNFSEGISKAPTDEDIVLSMDPIWREGCLLQSAGARDVTRDIPTYCTTLEQAYTKLMATRATVQSGGVLPDDMVLHEQFKILRAISIEILSFPAYRNACCETDKDQGDNKLLRLQSTLRTILRMVNEVEKILSDSPLPDVNKYILTGIVEGIHKEIIGSIVKFIAAYPGLSGHEESILELCDKDDLAKTLEILKRDEYQQLNSRLLREAITKEIARQNQERSASPAGKGLGAGMFGVERRGHHRAQPPRGAALPEPFAVSVS